MKHFANKNLGPVPREPFSLTVIRNEEEEVHHFQARVITDMASLSLTLTAGEKHPNVMVTGMMRMIGKMLDNKDGVPSGWEAEPLDPPQDAPDDWQSQFRAPDGSLEDFTPENVAKYTDYDAGSSRRRWLYLMTEDDEAEVDGEQITELFAWLASLAGKGRTRRSG